jgi:hypothetical protein
MRFRVMWGVLLLIGIVIVGMSAILAAVQT